MIAADPPDRRSARLFVVEADGTMRDLPRAVLATLFDPGDLVVLVGQGAGEAAEARQRRRQVQTLAVEVLGQVLDQAPGGVADMIRTAVNDPSRLWFDRKLALVLDGVAARYER